MPKPNAAVLLYNPEAGRIRSRRQLIPRLLEALRARIPSVEAAPTEGPMTAGRIARAWIERGADLVCVAGGDGTLNEAAAGVAGTGALMLAIPAGTANVLSNELGTGNHPLRVVERIDEMAPVSVAPGLLKTAAGERLFLCMAGAGLDARIVRQVSPQFKRRFGKLSYWEAGFAQLGRRLEQFEAVVGGRPYPCSFALISRVRNYGGDLWIARHASLLDDRLAVVLFEGSSSFRYLKYFAGVLFNGLRGMKGVHVLDAEEVEIRLLDDPVIDLQVDGEHAGFAPARVGLSARRLNLLAPPRYAAGRARLREAESVPGPAAGAD
ncbi:MAG: diacylglycerol kinase family protein [Bryobacteraceae bacterium]|nr:diacylglycerol kinase family protein [Bryobacteraceae bacterium]